MKKKLTGKIPSFTIIELVMAMLISSVIIGIVYYVYILFNHQFSNYREKAKVIDEYLVFQKALQHDLDSAEAIRNPSESEVICLGTNEENAVHYDFNKGSIVRSSGESNDTFFIKNNGFEAVPVNNMDLIETLVLKMMIYDEPVRATYRKKYSACQLMQQQPVYE